MKKRIVIVDDHASVRDMLGFILRREPDYEIVGEAGTGLQALEICESQRPDLMILDLVIPELSGTEVMRRVSTRFPSLRVIVYSGTLNQALIVEALKCKPHGFVEKLDTLDALRQAISTVVSGGSYFTASAAGFLRSAHRHPGETCELTAREREVLQLVAEGRSNKEIAGRLELTNKTVENHRAHDGQAEHPRHRQPYPLCDAAGYRGAGVTIPGSFGGDLPGVIKSLVLDLLFRLVLFIITATCHESRSRNLHPCRTGILRRG